MLAKSCEGYTSNPRNQLDSKKVLPLAGKFTPTAAAAQSQPPTSPHSLFTTDAVGHFNLLALVLVLVLVADVVGFALKYTVRHEICTCRYN